MVPVHAGIVVPITASHTEPGKGTNKGTAGMTWPDSRSESGLDEIWYRIPDARKTAPCAPT
jgi:hypothetical protein